jgi:hypothetical protein
MASHFRSSILSQEARFLRFSLFTVSLTDCQTAGPHQQSFSVPSPTGLMTIFYCLTAVGDLRTSTLIYSKLCIEIQFAPRRKHITSPIQSPTGEIIADYCENHNVTYQCIARQRLDKHPALQHATIDEAVFFMSSAPSSGGTTVFCNPFLSNGSVNTLPRRQ